MKHVSSVCQEIRGKNQDKSSSPHLQISSNILEKPQNGEGWFQTQYIMDTKSSCTQDREISKRITDAFSDVTTNNDLSTSLSSLFDHSSARNRGKQAIYTDWRSGSKFKIALKEPPRLAYRCAWGMKIPASRVSLWILGNFWHTWPD